MVHAEPQSSHATAPAIAAGGPSIRPRNPFLMRLHRGQEGTALTSSIFLGMVMVLLTSVIIMRAFAQSDVQTADSTWEQSVLVAEAGINQAVWELTADQSFTTGELSATLGDRASVVAAADAKPDGDVVATPEGEYVLIKPVDEESVWAVGYAPDRNDTDRQVRVVKATVENLRATRFGLPNSAVVSNGDVDISGNGRTGTTPPTDHLAGIITNGSFDGSRNAYVDGDVIAVGIAEGGTVYGVRQVGATPMAFPARTAIDAWEKELATQAQIGPTLGPISGSATVTAPAFIDGDITLTGRDTLTIWGPGVVYVNGNVTMDDKASIVNSSLLATAGRFTMAGQSSYTVVGLMSDAGVVSFAEHQEALAVTGQGVAVTMGLMWAANGGVKLTGNSALYGSLISSGEQDISGVKISGNGGILYPADLNVDAPIGPKVDSVVQVQRIIEIDS